MGIRQFLSEAFKAKPRAPRRLFDQWGSASYGSGSTEYAYANEPHGWMRAAQSSVWARNCIAARMSAMAQVPLRLYRGAGPDRVEVDTHPVLDLLREVNPLTHDMVSFRKAIEQQLCIFGQAVILKARGEGRQVRELYLLPPLRVEVIPDENTFIAGYALLNQPQRYSVDDIVRVWYPSPDGTIAVDSPTAAALDAINRYATAEVAQSSRDTRGGNAGGIVFHDPANIMPDDFEKVVRDWDRVRNNPRNAGRDMHIMGALDYKSSAFSAVDMDREARIMRLMNEIMAAYQVPPAIAGDYSDASKLANAAIQSKVFWETWALDEMRMWEEMFNYDLLWAEYPGSREDGLYLQHDLSGVAALQEDATEKAGRAATMFAAGIATRNESREMVGLDRLDDAAGDVLVAQMGEAPTAEVGANEPEPEPAPPQLVPQPIEQPPGAADAQSVDDTPPSAKATLTPVIDFVGLTATTAAGDDLGVIERIHRFGDHDGIAATKADPVVIVAGRAHRAADVRVRVVYADTQ